MVRILLSWRNLWIMTKTFSKGWGSFSSSSLLYILCTKWKTIQAQVFSSMNTGNVLNWPEPLHSPILLFLHPFFILPSRLTTFKFFPFCLYFHHLLFPSSLFLPTASLFIPGVESLPAAWQFGWSGGPCGGQITQPLHPWGVHQPSA